MKKRFLATLFACCLALSGCASSGTSSSDEEKYTPGTYTATEKGMGGDVTVEITFDSNKITEVKITGDDETPGIGTLAIEQLPDVILEAQSADVDVISSATVTSTAILNATATCIAQATGTSEESSDEALTDETADVIVIGAGGAGLSAAASAGQNGSSVIVLEANGIIGGSTIRSGGHILVFDENINATMERNDKSLQKYLDYNKEDFGEWSETLVTLQQQIEDYLESNQEGRFDSVEMALIDHYLKGQGTDKEGNEVTLDFDLTKTAFENANELNAWLCESGMEIQDKMYNAHGGTPVDGSSGLINALEKAANDAGAKILLNVRATELIEEDGVVTGVIATSSDGNKYTYHANKGVIIATGSFSSNGEMAAKYQTMGEGLTAENGSTNPSTNTGDGIVMAENIGAELRDMGFLCTLLAGYHGGCTTSEFGKINGTQQLILNANGVRFTNDAKLAGMTTIGGLNDQPGALAYYIGDSKMIEAINTVQEGLVDDLASRGDWFVVADTLEEALEKAGLDVETSLNSIEQFNTYVDENNDADFGRTEFNGKVENGPYVVAKMENLYHLTFGGLVINTNAEVLDTDNNVISHLYAAGDVTSGFEGATHQSGDCLTMVLYYGKVAGEQASKN